MAYAITNKDYSLSFISKDQNELSCQFPGYVMYQNGTAGYCFEISNNDSINLYLPKHISNSFGTELQAYKTLVENFDTSSLTYPTNISFERHLLNLGHPIISTLQIV